MFKYLLLFIQSFNPGKYLLLYIQSFNPGNV